MANPFSIISTVQGEVARVYIFGEIDLAGTPSMLERLGTFVHCGFLATIVIDLQNASFIDAAGVGALVATKNRADAAGRSLHVVGAYGQIAHVFALVGVTNFLTGSADSTCDGGEVAMVS